MKLQNVLPADIEKRSMEIIGEELGELQIDPEKLSIVKRVIHTSADFDYARNMRFSEGAVEKALEALKNGATIVTDTNMACTGINKMGLAKLGAKAVCFMADPDVAARAKAQKQFALWQTRTWQRVPKKRAAPVRQPAWKKPAPLKALLSSPLAMRRPRWYALTSW